MKDFAILHNTPKGQLLVTREFDFEDYIITIWFQTEKTGLMKMSVSTEDKKKANEIFEKHKDCEYVKESVNKIFNQEY